MWENHSSFLFAPFPLSGLEYEWRKYILHRLPSVLVRVPVSLEGDCACLRCNIHLRLPHRCAAAAAAALAEPGGDHGASLAVSAHAAAGCADFYDPGLAKDGLGVKAVAADRSLPQLGAEPCQDRAGELTPELYSEIVVGFFFVCLFVLLLTPENLFRV